MFDYSGEPCMIIYLKTKQNKTYVCTVFVCGGGCECGCTYRYIDVSFFSKHFLKSVGYKKK